LARGESTALPFPSLIELTNLGPKKRYDLLTKERMMGEFIRDPKIKNWKKIICEFPVRWSNAE
jgi:hypothetical protein